MNQPDEERRGELGGIARVFADLADRQAVWKTVLEGWNMKRSVVVQEWQAQGEMRGLLKASRQKLLQVLRFRFGQELPPEAPQAIEGQEDLSQLDRWFDQALAAKTVDEVRTFLGLTNGAAKQDQ